MEGISGFSLCKSSDFQRSISENIYFIMENIFLKEAYSGKYFIIYRGFAIIMENTLRKSNAFLEPDKGRLVIIKS